MKERFKIKGIERVFCFAYDIIDSIQHFLKPFITDTRPSIIFLGKNSGYRELVGAEIGVREGYNAKSILLQLNIKKLYLVDPFVSYVEIGLPKETCSIKVPQKILRRFKDKIEFVRLTSERAVNCVPNNLDFVYIDASHQADDVRNDITSWYKKIKQGGILAGHDVCSPIVLKEVISFLKNEDELFVKNIDWWIIKK